MNRGLMVAYQVKLEEAARLWSVACKGGNATGCTRLGLLLDEGLGVNKDPIKAAQLNRRACEGDLKDACKWARNTAAGQ